VTRALRRARLLLLAGSVLALAACQPRARRLLVLDLALTDPAVLSGIAEPWLGGGYHVEYRRFYPHPTRIDPTQYHVVVVLGGLAPEAPSDALRPADLAVLADWVRGGAVLVFGYAAGREGSLDRWIMTRWLDAIGAGIGIGDQPLRDSSQRESLSPEPQPWLVARADAPVRDAPLAPFPAGRNHSLTVANRNAVLAEAAGRTVIAAARLGDGLIIVTSRHALAALGPDIRPSTAPLLSVGDLQRTRAYLAALARWTRRPAEWARVPPVRRSRAIDLTGSPRPLSSAPVPRMPPDGVDAEALAPAAAPIGRPALPAWTRRQSVRVLRDDRLLQRVTLSGLRARTLDSLVEFLETAGLTALWAGAGVGAVAESAHWQNWEREAIRNAWPQLAERLQTTSIRWLPGVALADMRLPRDTVELDALGDTAAPWAALDSRLWEGLLRQSVRTIARLAAEQPEVIAGVVLDLGSYGMATGFSDPTFRVGLAAVPGDSAWKAALLMLPATARYDSLLESGRLRAFYDALEHATAQRAGALRAEVRRFSRQLGFAVRHQNPTIDWFSVGLLRGFSDSGGPVLLFTNAASTGPWLSVVRLDPAFMSAKVFEDNAGFWLDLADGQWPAPADSLARLVRQLTREARLPGGTGRR